MTVTKNLVGAIGICTAVFISGCGGGGGSSSGLPALDVPAAEATQASGAEAAATVLEMDGYTSGIGLMAASPASTASSTGFDPVAFGIEQSKRLQSLDFDSYALNAASQTENCPDGGTITVSGSGSSSSASMSVTYDHCTLETLVMNGKINMSLSGDLENYVLSSESMSFATDFTMTDGDMTMTIHQGTYTDYVYTSYDWDYEVFAGTVTSSLWVSYGDLNYRYDDLTVNFDDDYYDWILTRCYKAGRIYVNNLSGYLDIDSEYDLYCDDPFVWNYNTVGLESGSMEFIGSNDARIHVEATGDGGYTVTVTPN
jgi:hypothetical protein